VSPKNRKHPSHFRPARRLAFCGLLLAGGLVAVATAPTRAGGDDPAPHLERSRSAIKAFAKRLKAELVRALGKGGATAAISVCKEKAPEIARAVSEEHGLRLGRTSHKLRNPANAPDPWEAGVLRSFLARKAKGESPAALEYHEIVTRADGSRAFRYMLAIPTGAVCLICHGAKLVPEIRECLARDYP